MDCIRILWSVAFGLLLVSWSATVFAAVPTCSTVQTIMAPCSGFLKGEDPSSSCCSAVNKLNDLRKTRDDRVAICNCIKEATKSIPVDPTRIPLLSTKCGIKPEFPPIDRNYDCANTK